MKSLIILSALIAMSFNSHAGQEPTLFKEISRKTIIDLSNIELDNECSYAVVVFSVDKKKIRIHSIDASQKELRELVRAELESMVLTGEYEGDTFYRYRIVFEKE